jgi:transposase
VPEADKTCSCCGRPKTRIGEDQRRELEFIPAKLELRLHVLPKYARSHCHDGVKSPDGPDRPLSGCIAGAGLLSQLLISKFIDHLPLYRFEDISVRYGLHLPRATLCDWVRKSAELIRPLYEIQKRLVVQSPVIWTDDTPIKALGGDKPGSLTTRFWLYHGDEDHPYDVYDFTASRERDGPATFLKDFAGYLQADAYSGYDGLYIGSPSAIREVACWAHARRKFYDARSSSPGNAGLILEAIRRLYDVEDRARELSVEARQALRARESVPILERLRGDLDRLRETVLPKSALGQALTYARNQWAALCRYTEDGRLTIDNNVAERRLRDQAIGRKNWLFLGNVDAGPRAAMLSTIMAGAKRHRLEPWAYVKDVLMTLSVTPERVEDLLPDRWGQTHPEHVLTHRLEESREKARRRDARRAERRKGT